MSERIQNTNLLLQIYLALSVTLLALNILLITFRWHLVVVYDDTKWRIGVVVIRNDQK